jgi:hypothetical protein
MPKAGSSSLSTGVIHPPSQPGFPGRGGLCLPPSPMTTHQNRTVAANDGLITLYARREPALIRDPLLRAMPHLSLTRALKINHVVVYRDKNAQQEFLHFGSFATRPPSRRTTRIVLNCWLWRLEWLDDMACSSIGEIESARRARQWLQTSARKVA